MLVTIKSSETEEIVFFHQFDSRRSISLPHGGIKYSFIAIIRTQLMRTQKGSNPKISPKIFYGEKYFFTCDFINIV